MKPKLNCVMVIDDDEISNSMTKTVIDQSECTNYIVIKRSVQAAIRYLSYCITKTVNVPPPDLILLDIDISKSREWDFLEFYKEINETLPKRPVICMLTPNAIVNKILELPNIPDLAGLFEKPFTHKTFYSIFDKYFS